MGPSTLPMSELIPAHKAKCLPEGPLGVLTNALSTRNSCCKALFKWAQSLSSSWHYFDVSEIPDGVHIKQLVKAASHSHLLVQTPFWTAFLTRAWNASISFCARCGRCCIVRSNSCQLNWRWDVNQQHKGEVALWICQWQGYMQDLIPCLMPHLLDCCLGQTDNSTVNFSLCNLLYAAWHAYCKIIDRVCYIKPLIFILLAH